MNSRNVLLQILMLDSGIVPDVENSYSVDPEQDIFGFSSWDYSNKKTVDELLSTLSKKEKKAACRKFRKLWRKACKRYDIDPGSTTAKSRSVRRHMVKKMLLEDSK